ncbi:MAG: YfhO family protein, partial [Clostridiales bacterium]|nr:YfhO family protein [Clostridiales bacterium]
MYGHNKLRKQNVSLYVLAFLIPCVLMGIAMRKNGVYPFVDKSMFLWDLELQHKDYYSYLWDVLHGEANLQYSFSKSLGGRMVGILAFYVSSIFNFALLFIKKQEIAAYLSYITIVRISLSSVFCAFFLEHRFQLKRFLVLCLAMSYAMMEYNVCYCRNPMWMDGVLFLPLVCCGVYYVTANHKRGLLWGSIALSILCNWYTGYMLCLMSGIYCLFEILILQDFDGKDWKGLLRKFARYIFCALLGILASGVILVPSCVSLVGGKASFHLLSFKQYMSLSQVLDGFALTAPYNKSTAPLLYCGGFVLFVVIFGLIDRKNSVKKRIGYALLLFILLLSYSLKDVSLLWTAFVESSSYYFRFSFISGWIMVVIAADVLNGWEERRLLDLAPTILGTMIVMAIILDTNINDKKVVLYLILAEGYAVWVTMLIFMKNGRLHDAIYIVLGICLAFELTWN